MENTIKCPHCGKLIDCYNLSGDFVNTWREDNEWHASYEDSCLYCNGYILYEDVFAYHHSELIDGTK